MCVGPTPRGIAATAKCAWMTVRMSINLLGVTYDKRCSLQGAVWCAVDAYGDVRMVRNMVVFCVDKSVMAPTMSDKI